MALEYFPPRRGRPHYQPAWKDGVESKQEEAMWPYATCVIANKTVKTQNIGTLKAMAQEKLDKVLAR